MGNDVLSKICALLSAEDAELQCAAARVLGEIRQTDGLVMKALHDALGSPNQMVAAYALEAVARLHSAKSIAAIVPLLNGPERLRVKATEVLVSYGQAAGPVLFARLPRAGAEERRAIMRALALVGGSAATQSLLESIFDRDPEVARAATTEIRAAAEKMDAKDRAALALSVVKAFSDRRARKYETARASLARALGALGGPAAEKALAGLVSPRETVEVRRAALLGLEQMSIEGPGHDAMAKALLPLLREADWHNVVSHAIQVVYRIAIPRSLLPVLLKLVQSPHPPVRRFAVEKLGDVDSAPVAAALVKLLDHEDPRLRDQAASSLSRIEAAAAILVQRLKKGSDEQEMWTAAKILKGQGKPLKGALAPALRRRMADWIRAHDRRADPLVYLFRHVDPAALEKDLLVLARRAKSARRFDQAITYLAPLTRIDPPPVEALIELLVARIALSPKDLAIEARKRDEALGIAERLVASQGPKLAKRLEKERALAADGLLYIGFHFAERLQAEREFGATILKHVAKRYARTAAGKAAKNKLSLEAIA